MSAFRSKRSRSQIDYSKFNTGADLDDDDDFADATPPPGKKPKKVATKEKKEKKTSIQAALQKQTTSKTVRKPVNERSFDRELELALEMSRREAGICPTKPAVTSRPVTSSSQDSEDQGPGGESITVTAEITGEVLSCGVQETETKAKKKTAPVADKVEDPDLIEFLGQDEVTLGPAPARGHRQRRTSTQQSGTHRAGAGEPWGTSDEDDDDDVRPAGKRHMSTKIEADDKDSDFKDTQPASWDSPSSDSSDSSDSWGESDDSDFDGGKAKKGKKKTKVPPKKTPAKKNTVNKTKTNTADTPVYLDGIVISQPDAQQTSTPKSKPAVTKKAVSAKPASAHKENSVLPSRVSVSSRVSGGVSVGASPASVAAVRSTASPLTGHTKSLGAGIPRKPAAIASSTSRPSLGGCSSNLSSPSGGLRLGLSKKARIKPLHASVNIPH